MATPKIYTAGLGGTAGSVPFDWNKEKSEYYDFSVREFATNPSALRKEKDAIELGTFTTPKPAYDPEEMLRGYYFEKNRPMCEVRANRKKEVVEIGRNLALYLKEQGINNIFFLDRGARLGYIALLEAWHELYPGERPPHIYFTNPNGYREVSGATLRRARTSEQIRREFESTYTKLDKDDKIMLFDTCMHYGRAMKPVLTVLQSLGHDVYTGLTQPPDFPSPLAVDFVALDRTPEGGCYPFDGMDNTVSKDDHFVVSRKSGNSNLSNRIKRKNLMKLIKRGK